MNKSTDDEILAELAWRTNMMTYHLANCLTPIGGQFIETAWLLRQLKRMEKTGKVIRVRSNYAVQLCWAVASKAVA